MGSYGLTDVGVLLLFLVILGIAIWVLSTDSWPTPVVDPAALARARKLVQETLSPDEWKQLQEMGWLEVRSPSRSGTRYRIPALPGPVEMVEANGERRMLCLVPLSTLPAPELVLMHKLWIEADETEYLRRANRLPVLPSRDAGPVPREAWRWWWGV